MGVRQENDVDKHLDRRFRFGYDEILHTDLADVVLYVHQLVPVRMFCMTSRMSYFSSSSLFFMVSMLRTIDGLLSLITRSLMVT